MKPVVPTLLALLSITPLCRADNCDDIRAHIESRYRQGGLGGVVLQVVEAGSAPGGRVVGQCGSGRRQIVLIRSGEPVAAGSAPAPAAPAAAVAPASAAVPNTAAARPVAAASAPVAYTAAVRPAAPRARTLAVSRGDRIPTECKDGSVVLGPDCDDPAAVRMSADEIARSVASPASAASAAAVAVKASER